MNKSLISKTTISEMLQNAPFHVRKPKNFPGRGTAPPPTPLR